eukprot:8313867-Pyramimonas_sp.AAC.1
MRDLAFRKPSSKLYRFQNVTYNQLSDPYQGRAHAKRTGIKTRWKASLTLFKGEMRPRPYQANLRRPVPRQEERRVARALHGVAW